MAAALFSGAQIIHFAPLFPYRPDPNHGKQKKKSNVARHPSRYLSAPGWMQLEFYRKPAIQII